MSEIGLENAIEERLRSVLDPETGVDVVRMRLIEHLTVDSQGNVGYTFRPSSFVCPIAVSLALDIKNAVAEVPGVKSQRMAVQGYLAAEELENLINQELINQENKR